MSRNLKRVPLDFAWPLDKAWKGYLNPLDAEVQKCPDCELGYAKPHAALFYAQWYGREPFDPIAYGAVPLTIDHPQIAARARHNVLGHPSYYVSPAEQEVEAARKRKIAELSEEDLKKILDNPLPAEGVEDLVDDLMQREPSFIMREAIRREQARLFDLWRGQWCHHLVQADVDALVAARRLPDFTHRPLNADQMAKLEAQEAAGGSGYWLEESNGYHPTTDEVNAWSLSGLGHDAINQGVCVKARCAREGVPYQCPTCHGSAEVWPSAEVKAQHAAWEPTEPPPGEGYQLWQDCSEESPISPVFATLDELCAWAAENATTFGSFKASAKEWKKMLDGGVVHHKAANGMYL